FHLSLHPMPAPIQRESSSKKLQHAAIYDKTRTAGKALGTEAGESLPTWGLLLDPTLGRKGACRIFVPYRSRISSIAARDIRIAPLGTNTLSSGGRSAGSRPGSNWSGELFG